MSEFYVSPKSFSCEPEFCELLAPPPGPSDCAVRFVFEGTVVFTHCVLCRAIYGSVLRPQTAHLQVQTNMEIVSEEGELALHGINIVN